MVNSFSFQILKVLKVIHFFSEIELVLYRILWTVLQVPSGELQCALWTIFISKTALSLSNISL